MSLITVTELRVQGTLRPCCQRPENLTREHTVPQRQDLAVRLCRRCGRRHFRMVAEPGRLGVRPPDETVPPPPRRQFRMVAEPGRLGLRPS